MKTTDRYYLLAKAGTSDSDHYQLSYTEDCRSLAMIVHDNLTTKVISREDSC